MAEQAQSRSSWDDTVKARHDFDSWADINRVDGYLFIWRYALRGDEVEGWSTQRIRRAEPPGSRPILKTVWRPTDAKDIETLLSIDVFERDSRIEAHQLLVDMLGQFESSLVARDTKTPIGDVSFSVPGEGAILFARANVVVLVTNAGPNLVPVTDAARSLDADLVRRPTADMFGGIPLAEVQAAGHELTVGERTPLEVTVGSPLGQTVTLRFWSSVGEVRLINGILTYEARRAGHERISVLIINEAGSSAAIDVDLTISA